MKFQSKYNNHGFLIRPTLREYHPGFGWEIKQGLSFKFDQRTRIFDSVAEAAKRGWTDEIRTEVENYLLSCKQFGVSVFLLPGQDIPEEQTALMRVKPKRLARPCLNVELIDGTVVQCANEASAGRDYCRDHDPEETHILRDSVEQK